MNIRKIRARNIQRQHLDVLEAKFWIELIESLEQCIDQYEQGLIQDDESGID